MWNDALPRQGITNWSTFYPSGTSWQAWTKPAGCSWIYIYLQASGGGGGRTADGVTPATSDGGGSGGGAGGLTRMLIPAFVVPDVLYVRPGLGGLGATTANTVGSQGASSYVSMAPSTAANANYLIFQDGGFGGQITNVANSPGNSATVNAALIGTSLFTTSSGASFGTRGASVTNGGGGSITQTTSTLTTGGTGGGNGTGSGGAIINNVVFPTLAASAPGENGRNGFQLGSIIAPGLKTFPMIFSGGTGGGGIATAGVAGKGGNASYGGGGGGGGGGTNAGSTSGNGGNGGNGFVLIGAF